MEPGASDFYISHNHRSLETCLDSSLDLFHHTWLCVGRCVGRSGRGGVRPIGYGCGHRSRWCDRFVRGHLYRCPRAGRFYSVGCNCKVRHWCRHFHGRYLNRQCGDDQYRGQDPRIEISLSWVCHQVAAVWSWSAILCLVCSCLAASNDAATRCEGFKGLHRQGRDTVVLSCSGM